MNSASAELLQSVVEVARAIFGAEASSIFLLDEQSNSLIFQAVSGRGEEFLAGRRFPATAGIAGWVVASGNAMVIDDVSDDIFFSRELAESTSYVPRSIMAAPLTCGERILGVLEVLDPVSQSRSSLSDLDLLTLFARQAAAALQVISADLVSAGPVPARLDAAGREEANDLLRRLQNMLR